LYDIFVDNIKQKLSVQNVLLNLDFIDEIKGEKYLNINESVNIINKLKKESDNILKQNEDKNAKVLKIDK
jgi:hypothetical protein